MVDDDVITAATRFFAGQPFTIKPVAPGLSGAAVFRCQCATGEFALKRWPTAMSGDRIDQIHAVQRFARTSLELVPDVFAWDDVFACDDRQYRLTLGNHHFDCTTWMPGQCVAPAVYGSPGVGRAVPGFNIDLPGTARPTPGFDNGLSGKTRLELIASGAAAIARFHLATQGLGSTNGIAPAVIRRLQRLAELVESLPIALPIAQRQSGDVRAAGDYLAAHWQRLQHESRAILVPWSSTPVSLQWVLRDVHREHILFTDGDVSGLVDFDALKQDTVACDLARWVGSFADQLASHDSLWDVACAGYGRIRPISHCEQRLASAIEKVSWYIHLANWVIWTAGKPQDIPGGMETAERRIAGLLHRSNVRNRE